jgi:type I restriction enzyme M protein
LVWGIADQLRGVYKPHQYGGVILPFTILRRLDCILQPTRDEVRALTGKYAGGALDVQVKRTTGLAFYNTSAFNFKLGRHADAVASARPHSLRSSAAASLSVSNPGYP